MKDPRKSKTHRKNASRSAKSSIRRECNRLDIDASSLASRAEAEQWLDAYNQGWQEGSRILNELLVKSRNLGWQQGCEFMVARLLDRLKLLATTFEDTSQRIASGEFATKYDIAEDIDAKVTMVKNYVAYMQEVCRPLEDVLEEIAELDPATAERLKGRTA